MQHQILQSSESLGRVFTHLTALVGQLEASMRDGKKQVLSCLDCINADAVYRNISAGAFRPPVLRCERSNQLAEAILRIRDKQARHQDLAKLHLDTLERFLRADHGSGWEPEKDYFTVPVIVHSDSTVEAGFVYLRALPNMTLVRGAGELEQLTADPKLRLFGRDYFEKVASVLMRTFFFVHAFPFDQETPVNKHAYRLYFGDQITDGRSIGAAALAAFAVAFLHQRLGARLNAVVNPRRGTLLTGEIGDDGQVLPVEDIEEKAVAALDEFGPDLKMIVPASSQFSEATSRRLARANVAYVSNAEQLLLAALSSEPTDPRGLHLARRTVFQELTQPEKDSLRRFLQKGIERDVYTIIAQGGGDWLTPSRREGGVYLVATATSDQLDVRMGLEPSAVENQDSPERTLELLIVILDGSAAMNHQWEATGGPVCAVTKVVFEIARRFDPKRQQLKCGFLSHEGFQDIDYGRNAIDIERQLQGFRASAKLGRRGPFFRPLRRALLEKYANRQKQVFVLSDSEIPDLEDDPAYGGSSLVHLRLSPAAGAPAVLQEDGRLDEATIRSYFSEHTGKLMSFGIGFGPDLPVAWEPTSGQLYEGDAGGFFLRWVGLQDLKIRVRVRMAHQVPLALDYEGTTARPDGNVSFSFSDGPQGVVAHDTFRPWTDGALEQHECELWTRLCDPASTCICGRRDLHLLHDDETTVFPAPVFSSLRSLGAGWLVLRGGDGQWTHFQSGCVRDGVGIAVVNGRPHWSGGRNHLELARSVTNGLFAITTDSGTTLYLCRLQGRSGGRRVAS